MELNTELLIEWFLRVLAAALLGGVLGLERDVHGRAAGLRTHLLVCMGSAIFMVHSLFVWSYAPELQGEFMRVSDPARIAAQIITGIGFLGAGAIIKEGFSVRGLTTAANLWVAAAIGMTCGAGLYFFAAGLTLAALIFLVVLNYFERFINRLEYRLLTLELPLDYDSGQLVALFDGLKVRVSGIEYDMDYDAGLQSVRLVLRYRAHGRIGRRFAMIRQRLHEEKIPVRHLSWTRI